MKEKLKRKAEKRFCQHCGCEMIRIKRGAEENMMFYGDMSTIPLAGAYDKKTGLRNYCWYYKCPMYKERKWFQIRSPHDDYFIDEVFN